MTKETTSEMLARSDLAIAKLELEARQRLSRERGKRPVKRGNYYINVPEIRRIKYLEERIKQLEAKQQEKTQ